MIGELFKTVSKWAPPPAGTQSPTLWGTEEHLVELFGDRVEWMALAKREYVFRYHSPKHFAEWFMDFYGPITRLAGSLDGEDYRHFATELADVPRAFDLRGRRHGRGARGVPGGGRRTALTRFDTPGDTGGLMRGGVRSVPLIRLLGAPVVEKPGRQPRGKKAWGLLGYVVLSERPPSRRRLAELFFAMPRIHLALCAGRWPSSDGRSAYLSC